jgi:arginyl-tRNA synthetase
LKKNPNEIARELSEILSKLPEIEIAKSEGPYVNIRLNKNIFTEKFLEMYNSSLSLQDIPSN